MDIAFAFGADGPNAQSTFAAEMLVAKNIVKKHKVSPAATLVSTILYDSDAYVKSKFQDGDDQGKVIAEIDNIRRIKDGNNVAAALKIAQSQVFTTASGARANIPKVLVLFVDKMRTRDPESGRIAKELRNNGVKVIVVAVGPEVEKDAVSRLVGDSKDILYPSQLLPKTESVSSSLASLLRAGMSFKIFMLRLGGDASNFACFKSMLALDG